MAFSYMASLCDSGINHGDMSQKSRDTRHEEAEFVCSYWKHFSFGGSFRQNYNVSTCTLYAQYFFGTTSTDLSSLDACPVY